jgi:ubiquitin carboxyl-terminal hydrolase 7
MFKTLVIVFLPLYGLANASLSAYPDTSHTFTGRESDWGFTSFLPLAEVYNPAKNYIVDDAIVLRVEVNVRKTNLFQYDSRQSTGFVGLKNQGATCYMNSLLQTLYNINYFRQAVYHMPTTDEEAQKNIPLALQSLFYKMQFQQTSVSTKMLTKTFGWDNYESFMQHDVQELNRVLCEKLEDKMKVHALNEASPPPQWE